MKTIPTRLAAASGAFFVVAILVGGAMEFSGADDGTDGASALALLQRDPSLVNVVGFVLAMLGFVAFLVFLGYVHSALRRIAGNAAWVADVAFGAGLLSLAVKVGSIAPILAGTYRKDELTTDLARTLVDLNGAAFVIFGLLFGLFVAATGAACLAYRMSSPWMGWAGLVIGALAFVAGLVGSVDVVSYNPMAFVVGLAWTFILSLVLAVRSSRAAQPGTPETVARRADVAGAA
jgi:hypothetical protein